MDFHLKNQKEKFLNTISFIPSENYGFYNDYKKLLENDILGRYSFLENDLFNKSFPSHENIVKLQEDVTNKLKEKFNTSYLTLSSLSGMNALFTVLFSFTKAGDTVYFISPKDGGHSSSKKIAEKLGLVVKYIPFLESGFEIDFSKFRENLENENPSLIYVDQMTGIYPISLLPINDIISQKNIIAYNDISHNGAFVISGIHKNPLFDGYSMFGGSLHKTIPGPQKAYITTNDKNLFDKVIFNLNFLVSNNNPFYIGILGIMLEKMDKYWLQYTSLILENSKYFSSKLKGLGFEVLYDGNNFSNNHQVLFFAEPKISSFSLFSYLEKIGILVNILPLPFSSGKIGIRIGVQEFSFIGGTQKEIDFIISILKDFLNSGEKNIDNHKKIVTKIKEVLLNKFEKIYV